jgi:hypothetical protein
MNYAIKTSMQNEIISLKETYINMFCMCFTCVRLCLANCSDVISSVGTYVQR